MMNGIEWNKLKWNEVNIPLFEYFYEWIGKKKKKKKKKGFHPEPLKLEGIKGLKEGYWMWKGKGRHKQFGRVL